MRAPSLDLLYEFVEEAWDFISTDSVIYSFKKCEISNSLDGEEDDALWQDNSSGSSDDDESIDEPDPYDQRRSSRPPNPSIGGGPRPTLGAQVSLKLLFGYVTIFSSADLFTTDLNCRKKLACDIISECNVILSRRI